MYGYNYDELAYWGEKLKEKLLGHRRIKEVSINSEFSHYKDDYTEFYLDLDKHRLAKENITGLQLFSALRLVFGRDISCASIVYENQPEILKLTSRQSQEYDVWSLSNVPFKINGNSYKLSDFATVKKGLQPQKVAKENQQYRLCLQYEYIGSGEQGRKLLKKDLKEFNAGLPMGYVAEDEQRSWSWGEKDNRQYALLLIVIGIIFVTTSILFNSLKQPLAIIFVIPISYIGVFLTFYLFGLNFDQGGFASFVLLCGITVNASIYILNEYNDVRRRYRALSPVRAYVKAWNAKMIPIFLTVVSTILGFIPFMVGTGKEGFWFPLAAGTIGGLIMSIVGIFIFLPIFTLKK
jgi:multidrug efflux pump subunit AcrB